MFFQPLSHVQNFVMPWTTASQLSLSFTISLNLLKFMATETVMPYNHLILSCPLLLLPSIFSSIRVFSNESALLIRWPKYWSFGFSISSSMNNQGQFPLGLIGLISLLSKGLSRVFSPHFKGISSLVLSLFYCPVLSYIHTWLLEKNIALTIWTFVGKIMSLLFNMPSRLSLLFFEGVNIF